MQGPTDVAAASGALFLTGVRAPDKPSPANTTFLE